MNYKSLKEAVEAVEENLRINAGPWSSWQDSGDIFSVYEIPRDADVAAILDRAIASDGVTLPLDLRAAELAELGQNFGGSGFSHPGNAASAEPYWISRIEARYA